jgi:hypothetical protein
VYRNWRKRRLSKKTVDAFAQPLVKLCQLDSHFFKQQTPLC